MNNRFAILFDNFFLISDKTKNQLMNPISQSEVSTCTF